MAKFDGSMHQGRSGAALPHVCWEALLSAWFTAADTGFSRGLGEGQKSWSSTRNSAKRSSRKDTPTSTVYELEGRIIFAAIFATKLRGATRCDSINNRFFAPEIT